MDNQLASKCLFARPSRFPRDVIFLVHRSHPRSYEMQYFDTKEHCQDGMCERTGMMQIVLQPMTPHRSSPESLQ